MYLTLKNFNLCFFMVHTVDRKQNISFFKIYLLIEYYLFNAKNLKHYLKITNLLQYSEWT